MVADERPRLRSKFKSGTWWRRGLNLLLGVVLLLIVLVFIATAVPQAVGADHSYVVLSGSMHPTLEPGDVIFVRGVDPTAIEEGDIITFNRNEDTTPTTHRVIEVVEQDGQLGFRMKGDANEDPDQELITPDEVEGRLMSVGGLLFIIPAIGYMIHFANTPVGFTVLVLLPIAALAASEIWSFLGTMRSSGSQETSSPDSVEEGFATESRHERGADKEEDVLVTFQPRELRLGSGVLVVFTAYSILVAYLNPAAWSIGMAVAVAIGTILLLALYRSGNHAAMNTDSSEAGDLDTSRHPTRSQPGPVEGSDAND